MASLPEESLDEHSQSGYSKSRYGKTVTILVGADERKFVVYHHLLYTESPFFRGCLDGNFKEKESGIIKFPKDDPDVFETVLNWLHGWNSSDCEDSSTLHTLIKAYVLADKLMMLKYQNAMMNSIRRFYEDEDIHPTTIALVESFQLDVHSPLVRFFTKKYAHSMVEGPRNYVGSCPDSVTLKNFEDASLATAVVEQILKYLANSPCMSGCRHRVRLDPALEEEYKYHVYDKEDKNCPQEEEVEEEGEEVVMAESP